MKEMSVDRIIEKETKYFKEEQHKYDCYMDLSDEGKRTWSEGKQAKYEAEYHRQIIEKLNKLAEYERLYEGLMSDKNKLLVEAELSDSQVEALNNKNIDISEPFATNVTLDYGDKVIYCAGKVQSFYKAEKNQGKKKLERNQEYERD